MQAMINALGCPYFRRALGWCVPKKRSRVDLRAGGGTCTSVHHQLRKQGRSPRGRRNRGSKGKAPNGGGSISARAEEPDQPCWRVRDYRVDLRAGGGTKRTGI